MLHGWPGIAFSQYLRDDTPLDWPRTTRWTTRILADLLTRPAEPGLFYNVNFPHLPADALASEIVSCPLDPNRASPQLSPRRKWPPPPRGGGEPPRAGAVE